MLDENQDALFARHIPIPHRSLLVVEDGTSGGVYLDEFTPKAINAVLTLAGIDTLGDFPQSGTRELIADDYIYQIKRLAHPRLHSPIFGMMSERIVGLKALGNALERAAKDGAR